MGLKITAVNIQGVQRRLKFDEQIARSVIPQALEEVSQRVPDYVGRLVPRRTGELQNSVVVSVTAKSLSVYFTAPYAVYVDEGTEPSKGRYVPVLGFKGKRLVNVPNVGEHPGFRGAHFMEAIEHHVVADVYSTVADIVMRGIPP